MEPKRLLLSPYAAFACLGAGLMMAADLFAEVCPAALDRADEAFGLCCMLLSARELARGRTKVCWYELFLLFAVLLGLLGNGLSGVQSHPGAFLTDAFLFLKPYAILFYFHLTLNERRAKAIYRFLMRAAKLLVPGMAACAAWTMLVPTEMCSPSGAFWFWSGFSGTVSWWTILFLALLSSDPANRRTGYALLCAFIVLRTQSGLGSLALVLAVLVFFLFEQQKRFHWYQLLAFLPVCLWVGRNEITEYLLNQDAPRFLLFYYAFVTANTFFPLGAGFAAYGSTMAITYYSRLYYQYGFDRRWGMSEQYHPYLMDSYFPQIIGQLGYAGAVCYAVFLLGLFRRMLLCIPDKNCRCSGLYLFLCWAAAGLGFGTASSWGCTVYLLLPVLAQVGRCRAEQRS